MPEFTQKGWANHSDVLSSSIALNGRKLIMYVTLVSASVEIYFRLERTHNFYVTNQFNRTTESKDMRVYACMHAHTHAPCGNKKEKIAIIQHWLIISVDVGFGSHSMRLFLILVNEASSLIFTHLLNTLLLFLLWVYCRIIKSVWLALSHTFKFWPKVIPL